MATDPIQLDGTLHARLVRLAAATGRTLDEFIVEALEDKVSEAEALLHAREDALRRDQALRSGEQAPIEWRAMKSWLRQRLGQGPRRAGSLDGVAP